MKIEFFYKCKDGTVIGKEKECDDKYEREILNIKQYTKKLESDKKCKK